MGTATKYDLPCCITQTLETFRFKKKPTTTNVINTLKRNSEIKDNGPD